MFSHFCTALLVVVATILLLADPVPVHADTFTVNTRDDGGDETPGDGKCATAQGACTLRAAVQEANDRPGPDLILLRFGEYTLTLGGLVITSDLDIQGQAEEENGLNFPVIQMSTQIQDRVIEVSFLPVPPDRPERPQHQSGRRTRQSLPGPSVGLSDLIIRQGQAPAGSLGGAGILNASTLTLSRVTVTQNTVECMGDRDCGGAAIHNLSGAQLTAADSVVSENTLTCRQGQFQCSGGGGILNRGTMTLTRVTLSGNTVVCDGDLNCQGGAVSNLDSGRLTVEESTLSSNEVNCPTGFPVCDIGGGGIFNQATLTVASSTISSNTVTCPAMAAQCRANGGGIFNQMAELNLGNSTISGNQVLCGQSAAECDGGGIRTRGGSFQIAASTIAFNAASCGGGVRIGTGTACVPPGADGSWSNSIVARNTGGDCLGNILPAEGAVNLDSDGSCGAEVSGVDPLLDELADNGGPTPTHAIPSDSRAVDAAPLEGCPATDQRGAPRGVDGNGDESFGCDLGAYEVPPSQPSVVPRIIPAASQFGNPVQAYVQLGASFTLNEQDPRALLGHLGAFRPDILRLFRYDPAEDEYIEFTPGDEAFDFTTGRGFWLISRFGGLVEMEGTPNPATGTAFPMPDLQPGFQLVTFPFNFPLDWTGCLVDRLPQGVTQALFGYDQGYQMRDVVQPGEAYWVCNSTDQTITGFSISPLCALSPTADPSEIAGLTPKKATTQDGWRLKVSAASGPYRDTDNYIGEDRSALMGYDSLDYPDPPLLQELSLYFYRPDWSPSWPYFTSDIRSLPSRDEAPLASSPQVWDFQVWTGFASATVELRWNYAGPEGKDLTLRDLEGQKSVSMDPDGVFRFSARPGIRHFQVIAR